jgi:hypothetical protein
MPRWLTYTLTVLVIVLIAVALAAPLGPMPGIRIGGTAAEPPPAWDGAALPDEVRFATYDGALPYVVTIWIVESGGGLYVVGAPESTWVQKATSSPEVKVRIGDQVFDMLATRMPPGREDVLAAYIERYEDDYPEIIDSLPPLEELAAGSALFELTPR